MMAWIIFTVLVALLGAMFIGGICFAASSDGLDPRFGEDEEGGQ